MTQKVLVSEEQIAQRVQELALQISSEIKDVQFILVSVLKGAAIFTADLQRALYKAGQRRFIISYVTLRTYTSGTEASKKPVLEQELDFDPKGKHLLVVDDVIDAGFSLSYLVDFFKSKGAVSVKTCVLVSKPEKRKVAYEADYKGFTLPDVWLEGYGMDTDEFGRSNPDLIEGPSLS